MTDSEISDEIAADLAEVQRRARVHVRRLAAMAVEAGGGKRGIPLAGPLAQLAADAAEQAVLVDRVQVRLALWIHDLAAMADSMQEITREFHLPCSPDPLPEDIDGSVLFGET